MTKKIAKGCSSFFKGEVKIPWSHYSLSINHIIPNLSRFGSFGMGAASFLVSKMISVANAGHVVISEHYIRSEDGNVNLLELKTMPKVTDKIIEQLQSECGFVHDVCLTDFVRSCIMYWMPYIGYDLPKDCSSFVDAGERTHVTLYGNMSDTPSFMVTPLERCIANITTNAMVEESDSYPGNLDELIICTIVLGSIFAIMYYNSRLEEAEFHKTYYGKGTSKFPKPQNDKVGEVVKGAITSVAENTGEVDDGFTKGSNSFSR